MNIAWALSKAEYYNALDPEAKKTGTHAPVAAWTETINGDDGEFLAGYTYRRCSCGTAFVVAQSLRSSIAQAFDASDEIYESRRHFTVKAPPAGSEPDRVITHKLPMGWDWSKV